MAATFHKTFTLQSKTNTNATNPNTVFSHTNQIQVCVRRHTNWPFLLAPAPVSVGTVKIISRIHPVSLLAWIFHERDERRKKSACFLSLGLLCLGHWLSITAGEPDDKPFIRNTNNALTLRNAQTASAKTSFHPCWMPQWVSFPSERGFYERRTLAVFRACACSVAQRGRLRTLHPCCMCPSVQYCVELFFRVSFIVWRIYLSVICFHASRLFIRDYISQRSYLPQFCLPAARLISDGLALLAANWPLIIPATPLRRRMPVAVAIGTHATHRDQRSGRQSSNGQ